MHSKALRLPCASALACPPWAGLARKFFLLSFHYALDTPQTPLVPVENTATFPERYSPVPALPHCIPELPSTLSLFS